MLIIIGNKKMNKRRKKLQLEDNMTDYFKPAATKRIKRK
jgi:hypothetical protein